MILPGSTPPLALLALLLLSITTTAVSAPTAQQIAQSLRKQLSAGSLVVLTSDHTAYAAANFTPRYDIAAPPTYNVATKPLLATDVQKVVQYARRNNVSFLATGGGHGYSNSLGALQSGINVDLGAFNGIRVDAHAGTMTIGGAVSTDAVARALQAVGMEITLSECGCIGFPGATLGGGIGPYSGLYGPMSDSLISVEFITGTGHLLNVSSTHYPDLFYGLKGAGFNYGIATSLTYQIYPATNGGRAMLAQMVFPAAANETVFTLAAKLSGAQQPKELSVSLDVRYLATVQSMVIMANFIYAGPQAAGVQLIQPFLDLQPSMLNVSTVAWADISKSAFYGGIAIGGCASGAYYVPYSVNVYDINVPNLVSVFNYMNSTMVESVELQGVAIAWAQYSPYGFQLQGSNASAWAYRDVATYLQIDGVAANSSQLPAVDKYSRKIRDMLQKRSGRADLEVYVHFAHGDESPAALYSKAKLPTLKKLKDVYDPLGLFSFYNPVRARI